MKKAGLVAVVVLIGMCLGAYAILPIPVGYAAKNMCSSVFVAGLEEEYVDQHDLDFSVVSLMHTQIDEEARIATASFLGLRKATAFFRNDQCGCTLGEIDEVSVPASYDFHPLPDSLAWPYGTRATESTRVGLETRMNDRLAAEIELVDNATRALLVVHNGEIIGEQYLEGFDESSLMLGWSMTKSITGTLVGLLAAEGMIDINAPAPVTGWERDKRKDIRWKDLLQMQSGLEWGEYYSLPSDITNMLYREQDVFTFAAKAPYEAPPGTVWKYSSGSTNILSGLVRQVLGNGSLYHTYPYRALFDKIGAHSFVMEMDGAGNFIGSSYAYATARDWAKFGLLYLHRGVWNGDRLLPEWWIDFVATPASDAAGDYGGQFWLNRGGAMPDVPEDMMYCRGFGGQQVYIIPSMDLVVVRLGLRTMDFNEMLSGIIEVLQHSDD